jgi:hypothetical protein
MSVMRDPSLSVLTNRVSSASVTSPCPAAAICAIFSRRKRSLAAKRW